jgi:hypothetical protein
VHTRWAVWLPGVVALASCGDAPVKPELSVSIFAAWNEVPTTAAELGYDITVTVRHRSCEKLVPGARLTVDGRPLPLTTTNPCDVAGLTFRQPADWNNAPVTVEYEVGGRVVATGIFEDLAPGVGTTLSAPLSVHAGDDILIVPPAALPTSDPHLGWFYPLEGLFWQPGRVDLAALMWRQPDGIRVRIPFVVGPTILAVAGMPRTPEARHTCDGFAGCVGFGSNTLGPIHVKVDP